MNGRHSDWRKRLLEMKIQLASASQATRQDRATVELDQQSVGRLSRMDALQQQSMAKAEEARRRVQATRIDAALARLDDGEFGYCTQCGQAIAPARLDLDPTAPLCVDCARG